MRLTTNCSEPEHKNLPNHRQKLFQSRQKTLQKTRQQSLQRYLSDDLPNGNSNGRRKRDLDADLAAATAAAAARGLVSSRSSSSRSNNGSSSSSNAGSLNPKSDVETASNIAWWRKSTTFKKIRNGRNCRKTTCFRTSDFDAGHEGFLRINSQLDESDF